MSCYMGVVRQGWLVGFSTCSLPFDQNGDSWRGECSWFDSDDIGIVIVVEWVESIQNHCVALMDCMDYEI